MRPPRTCLQGLVTGLILLTGATLVQGGTKADLVLLTPQEARELRLSDALWRPPPLLRSLPRGPRVVVRRPGLTTTPDGPVIVTGSPTDLVISFEETGAPVDMGSLEVRAKKGFFSVSLTDRLKPYLRGATLEATAIKIPEGRFLIQVEIADRSGGRTVDTFRLEVKAQ